MFCQPGPPNLAGGRPWLRLSRIPPKIKINRLKITIDVPESELQEAMRHTGARTEREAVATALLDFNRRQRLQRLAQQFGTFEEVFTLKELRSNREED
jgi:Arc/MetJ family transcription regulator